MPALLLDTCAILYIANDLRISPAGRSAIREASTAREVLVSPISAWEIGLLAAKGRLQLLPDAKTWFHDFLERPAVSTAPLESEMALDAWTLPGAFHGDPADRLLVATARALRIPMVTRDRHILAYGAAGHVDVIRC